MFSKKSSQYCYILIHCTHGRLLIASSITVAQTSSMFRNVFSLLSIRIVEWLNHGNYSMYWITASTAILLRLNVHHIKITSWLRIVTNGWVVYLFTRMYEDMDRDIVTIRENHWKKIPIWWVHCTGICQAFGMSHFNTFTPIKEDSDHLLLERGQDNINSIFECMIASIRIRICNHHIFSCMHRFFPRIALCSGCHRMCIVFI